MDRKHFLKSALLTTGGLLMGGAAIYRYLNSKETTDDPLMPISKGWWSGDIL